MTDSDDPSTGSYFEITAELLPNMSTTDGFYIDISFPGGIDKVEIKNKYDWEQVDIYKPGDLIYNKNKNQISASYHLVSAYISYSDGYKDLRLKMRVYPNISGQMKIYYRGSRTRGAQSQVIETDPSDYGGNNTDQQGWRVYREYHTVNVNQAPVVTLNTPVISGQTVNFSWYGTDLEGDQILFSYRLDSNNWSTYTDTIVRRYTNLSVGDHYFYVKCKDNKDNNGNTAEKKINIAVVNHAPVVVLNTSSVSGQTANFGWSGSDSDGDQISYSYQLDTGGWSTWSTGTTKQYDNLSAGSHTFYVKCKDALVEGNTESRNFTIQIDNYYTTYKIFATYDNSSQVDTLITIEPYWDVNQTTGNMESVWVAKFVAARAMSITGSVAPMFPYLLTNNVALPALKSFGLQGLERITTLVRFNIPVGDLGFLQLRFDLGTSWNPFVHINIMAAKTAEKNIRPVSFLSEGFLPRSKYTVGELLSKMTGSKFFIEVFRTSNMHLYFADILGYAGTIWYSVDVITSVNKYGDPVKTAECEIWSEKSFPVLTSIINSPDFQPITTTNKTITAEYEFKNLAGTPCENYSILQIRAKGVSGSCYFSDRLKLEWLNVSEMVTLSNPIAYWNTRELTMDCIGATSFHTTALVPGSKIKITYPAIAGYQTPSQDIIEAKTAGEIITIEKEYIPNGSVMIMIDNSNLGLSVVTPQGITVNENGYDTTRVYFSNNLLEKKMILKYGAGNYSTNIGKPTFTIGSSYSVFAQTQEKYEIVASKINIITSGTDNYHVNNTVTDVKDEDKENLKSTTFSLSQNYPNPFNPSTTIFYVLQKQTHVQIIVFNVLGKRLKTLEDKEKNPGSYQVLWDGKDENGMNLPSGIYFYSLKTEMFFQTKKMTLIK